MSRLFLDLLENTSCKNVIFFRCFVCDAITAIVIDTSSSSGKPWLGDKRRNDIQTPHSPKLTRETHLPSWTSYKAVDLYQLITLINPISHYFWLFCYNLLILYSEHNSIIHEKWFPVWRRSTRTNLNQVNETSNNFSQW